MSQVEVITGEVRRLVLRCRTLEAQLQQSVPKKTHEETVAKLQERIDGLTSDLSRANDELQKTTAINSKLELIESKISSQNEAVTSQSQKIDFISGKVAENISKEAYTGALSKTEELERRIQSMVERSDYDLLEAKVHALNEQIVSMVPASKYAALEAEIAQNFVPKTKYQELEHSFSQTVPKRDFEIARARVAELEEKLNKIISVTEALFSSAGETISDSHGNSEIREVQSNLSEIHGAESTLPAETPSTTSSVSEPPAQVVKAQTEVQAQ